MDRFELELAHRVVERRDAPSVEPSREPRPLPGDAVVDLPELPEDMTPVGIERELEPALADLRARPDVLEPRPRIPERDEHRCIAGRKAETVGEGPPDDPLRSVRGLHRVASGAVDPSSRRSEPGVIQDERSIGPRPVRIGE